MEHTWQTDFLPKLAISNLEKGDVAICSLSDNPTGILPLLEPQRITFIAPYHSRSDLEWLLRGLLLHPEIRQLVICGDDDWARGEALLALWQYGLEPGGHISGGRGQLSCELGIEVLNALREDVDLLDFRGKQLNVISQAIQTLPKVSDPTARQPAPNPQIPRRKVFHSRQTTFPIFSSDVGDAWLQLLNLALKIGTDRPTANTERIAEALNAVVTIETPELEDGEPQKKEEIFPNFFDFNRQDFDHFYTRYHEKYWRTGSGADLLQTVVEQLQNSPDALTCTLPFLDPDTTTDAASSPRDIGSDLISATFNVNGQALYGSFVLRSADLYTAWPHEATALIHILCQIAEQLGLDAGSATFIIHSAHLYERDWSRSLAVLEAQFKRPLPLHVDPSGIFLFGNDSGKATGMLLAHDASTIFWEEGFSDPEDLSWYIVDTMPWLLPQHVRYVGQECAALMRSIKEDEDYVQG
ncbi:MAG: hypothetical protein HOC23_09580 [Halieaceae bacterium]|nr:hypothetical protein [Halieaceae bacterium]